MNRIRACSIVLAFGAAAIAARGAGLNDADRARIDAALPAQAPARAKRARRLLILFLLWHPALSIATLRPQQNVVAVLVDDSRSMGIKIGRASCRERV